MIELVCKRCQRIYFRYPYLKNKSSYCSNKCTINFTEKICQICGKKSFNNEQKNKKFCSVICKNQSQIGKKRPEVSGPNNYWFGKKLSKKRRQEISKMNSGKFDEKSHAWKGANVGYDGIHRWVQRKLGKPKKCEMCGLDNPNRIYDWANKSGKYKRDLTDWMRLCRSCHRKYDIKYNNYIVGFINA